jgi:pyruvate,water dikinase
VEACFGLGEALVAGRVNADVFTVRDGEVVARAIATKHLVVEPLPGGGTHEVPIDPERQGRPALTVPQAVQLARLGRRLAAHFGRPQDIEWCLVDDGFRIVQSRPITTLFPIPAAVDEANRVYVSVGHQQMMTDPMKPLGLSLWQLTTPRPMAEAGGRLFVDVTQGLASPEVRAGLLDVLGRSDPLIGDALQAVVDRGDFVRPLPGEAPATMPPGAGAPASIETDPAVVTELIGRSRASLAAVQREIPTRSGPALLEFILEDLQELRRILFDPTSHQVVMAGIEAGWWLREHLQTWLGDGEAADTLNRSVPHNVTSEMGLALLDVADVIRPHPEVVTFLKSVEDEGFLDALPRLAGGREARDAIRAWLDEYGMRCVGEIDVTRPRWSERPITLVPMILGNVEGFEPGEAKRRFEHGRQEARAKEREVLERLRASPNGEEKAEEAKRMIDRLRAFAGYREYPKYGMVSRYFVYKRALLDEADRLVQAQVLADREDIFYLGLQELHDVVRANRVDAGLIRERRDAFATFGALTPPRVITSDGEVITGTYRRGDVPADALAGLPVSAGIVEGKARVIRDVSEAELDAGDILVTAYTDPSFTPLFVAIKGLVTEVGGLMTHGAVIAREYGLPAVVGVEHATGLIRDGQRIRVHGTDGYVELLP